MSSPPLFQQPEDRAVVPFVAGLPVALKLLAERRMVEIRGTLLKRIKGRGAVVRVEQARAQLLALPEAERLLAT